jgi:hypothetical protein
MEAMLVIIYPVGAGWLWVASEQATNPYDSIWVDTAGTYTVPLGAFDTEGPAMVSFWMEESVSFALDSWGLFSLVPVWPEGCCLVRGDIDHNGTGPDIADLVYLVSYMFPDPDDPGPPPPCEEPEGSGYYAECDVNGDGTGPDIADLVYLVSYMFPDPSDPGPPPVPCE